MKVFSHKPHYVKSRRLKTIFLLSANLTDKA